jgi:hypothetical protein
MVNGATHERYPEATEPLSKSARDSCVIQHVRCTRTMNDPGWLVPTLPA